MSDRLLTATEVATLLHVTPETIRRAARAGSLPCLYLGRLLRFRPADLEALLANQPPTPTVPRRADPPARAARIIG